MPEMACNGQCTMAINGTERESGARVLLLLLAGQRLDQSEGERERNKREKVSDHLGLHSYKA